ncbi:MAG TPA: hypothetical protein VL172_00295 [Kofleriaceae bacterium]|nr:hypothetical protein [Kofleriaceae bacterium]
MHWLARAAVVGSVALVGCVDADERAEFTYVHSAILVPSCATSNCHSDLGSSFIGNAEAGLALDDRESAYMVLTGHICEGTVPPDQPLPDRNFVEPGDPEASQLVRMIRGIDTYRMPPDTPLPEGEIQAIEEWIRRGALCD